MVTRIIKLERVRINEVTPLIATGHVLSSAMSDKTPLRINAKISFNGFGKWAVYCGNSAAVTFINSKFEGRVR